MRDYYEILGVATTAENSEIKTAYRKAALKYHPDRNFGKVEEATKEFADVQSAYEILSDVNERAWYDRHKDSILRGDDAEGSYEAEDVVGLSANQLMSFFDKVTSSPIDDSKKGFFTVSRKLFDDITNEEHEACQQQGMDPPNLPSFGHADSDDYDVRAFYHTWSTFASNKTFSWAEIHAYHRAPDRRVRRAMEKENAKLRTTERREYNEVIHKLISYMKKRDYRFIAKPQISVAQRQQELLESRKIQAEASRAANRAKLSEFQEQDWQKVDDKVLADEEMQAFEEWETEIECVACGKIFKSERQYTGHEKSKKHIQTVKRLKWEMKKEAMALGLDYDSSESFVTAEDGSGRESADDKEPDNASDVGKQTHTVDTANGKGLGESTAKSVGQSPVMLEDDDYISRKEFEARLDVDSGVLADLALSDLDIESDLEKDVPIDTNSPKKKKAKAKAKVKAKKKNRG